jgi:hypothetical protein
MENINQSRQENGKEKAVIRYGSVESLDLLEGMKLLHVLQLQTDSLAFL